jgi:hypothetical protein
MKMPLKNRLKNNQRRSTPQSSPRSVNRCAFETSDGRRCRMPRLNNHPSLCPFHAHEELQLLEADRLGAELAASVTGDFMTATDINFVLGKLFTALAQRRIPARNAATLAYISQLMLHSLPNVKKEYPFVYKYETWNNMRGKAISLSNSSPASAGDDSENDSDDNSDDDAADSPDSGSPDPEQS